MSASPKPYLVISVSRSKLGQNEGRHTITYRVTPMVVNFLLLIFLTNCFYLERLSNFSSKVYHFIYVNTFGAYSVQYSVGTSLSSVVLVLCQMRCAHVNDSLL